MRLSFITAVITAVIVMPKEVSSSSPLRRPPTSSVKSPKAREASQGMPDAGQKIVADAYAKPASPPLSNAFKLLIGAGGIYASFLYYGSLQEDVFHYTSASGEKFKYAWFLQVLGACLIAL
jgi:hypothetical protein